MHNFIPYFDLHCISKVEMGMMGTLFFIGFTISCMIVPRLADIKGRRFTFIAFFHFHALGSAVMLFVPHYYAIYIGLFMVGIASAIRTSVGYIYSLEFIESSK